MKKLLTTLLLNAAFILTILAQAPEKINYQGVARDLSGNVIANAPIGLQIKLHSTSPGGSVVYSETHAISTNGFGLFNVQIGTGSNVTGTFSSINWGSDAFYAEVLMDASGGTAYISMGTQQLISVPYALYAKTAGYTAGSGITINGSVISALNNNSMWDAFQLQGNAISTQEPAIGEYLMWNGDEWVPAPAPSSGTGNGSNAATLIYTVNGF